MTQSDRKFLQAHLLRQFIYAALDGQDDLDTAARSPASWRPLDAHEALCNALQSCEYSAYGTEPVTFHGFVVQNFCRDVERRGKAQVFGCDGIYATGSNPDGTPRYAGPVCAFESEEQL